MYVLFILCVTPRLLSTNNQTFERRRYVNTEFDWNSHGTLDSTRYTRKYVPRRVLSCKYIIDRLDSENRGGKRVFELLIASSWLVESSHRQTSKRYTRYKLKRFEFRFYLKCKPHQREKERN